MPLSLKARVLLVEHVFVVQKNTGEWKRNLKKISPTPPYITTQRISYAGDTLSSRHVSSCDLTRAVGMW